ncbi:glycosyltransferase [Magnetospirillum sp. UT-4]|uniref:glycosyltransferase n=1 Tax=Magnetospirillum sp. UT-4 TaxID=2681467 RepID=UPI0020C3F80D|nr:glycosyltransferase [Magnetospirillum sp. UT-4]
MLLARSLSAGGAERQLACLAAGLRDKGHLVTVVAFYPGGALHDELDRLGLTVLTLGKRGRWDVLGPIWRLLRLVRTLRPDIVQGFLAVPNLLALVAARICGARAVLGVRASNMDLSRYDRLSALTYRLEALAAGWADLIVSNSAAGLDAAWRRGFPRAGMVIPNGIDTRRFAPCPDRRAGLRRSLGVEPEHILVGMVARFDPMKDHETFLAAAARLSSALPAARFVCVGAGPAARLEALRAKASSLGLAERLDWLPFRPDPETLYNGLDVLVSTSAFGEGFSNVIGEALACGVPVVATDVGDARAIVGDAGAVVSPADPEGLADAVVGMAGDLGALRDAARRRGLRFALPTMIDATEAAYRRLCEPKVVHVITGLGVGGAERTLVNLVRAPRSGARHVVVSLSDASVLGGSIEGAGVALHVLGMRPAMPSPLAVLRLALLLWRERPAVVMTWLYHADLVGTLAHLVAGRPGRLIWNIRCSDMDLAAYGVRTGLVRRAVAALSRLPAAVIANSKAGLDFHTSVGYRPRRTRVIANGVDLERFRPDPETRARRRSDWGVTAAEVVVGMIARFDPMKDHLGFCEAAAQALARHPALRFIMAGRHVDAANTVLRHVLEHPGLRGRVTLLGEVEDVAGVLPGLDVFVLSSAFGEGFPNVVAEAMACGVPCVVTASGDAPALVGDAGLVTPVRDPRSLADALVGLANAPEERKRLGERARMRIEAGFDLEGMLGKYRALWDNSPGPAGKGVT